MFCPLCDSEILEPIEYEFDGLPFCSEECCERYFLTCVASEDWPCLFHGVIEYPFPFLRDDRQVTIGDFLFPKGTGVIHRAYLVCSYEAGQAERCLPRPAPCDSDCKPIC